MIHNFYEYPQEEWDEKKCARIARKHDVDGYGGRDSVPGKISDHHSAYEGYGLTQHYNPGKIIDGKLYRYVRTPLPKVPDNYEIYSRPTWGWYIRKRIVSKEYPTEKRVNKGKHRGVQIFRQDNMIPGSDMRELKSGEMKPCKPKYESCYRYAGSAWYDSVAAAKEGIDRVWNEGGSEDPKAFVEVMNTEE